MEQINTILTQYEVVKEEELKKREPSFLKIITKEYELKNGNKVVRESVVKRQEDAVIIIPRKADGKFVVIVEPRPVIGHGSIDFPAGYREEKEELLISAKRELKEETGYTSNHFENIGSFYQDNGCSKSKITVFYAKECEKTDPVHWDEDEEMTTILLTKEEIMKFIKAGLIQSGNMFSSLFLLENRLAKEGKTS